MLDTNVICKAIALEPDHATNNKFCLESIGNSPNLGTVLKVRIHQSSNPKELVINFYNGL